MKKSPSPCKDRGDGVGRGLLALLVHAVVAGHSAVSSCKSIINVIRSFSLIKHNSSTLTSALFTSIEKVILCSKSEHRFGAGSL